MANYTPSTPNNFLGVRAEFDKIAEAIEWQLDREGTSPNYMQSDLDMNGFSIVNYNLEELSPITSVFGRQGEVVALAEDYSEFYLQTIENQSIGKLVDVDLTGLQVGYSLSWNGMQFVPTPNGGGGSSAFTGLVDTPNSYTGHQGKAMVVNLTETGLEFTDNLDNLINTVDGGSF